MAFILVSGISPQNSGVIEVPKTAVALVVNALVEKVMVSNNVQICGNDASTSVANAVFGVTAGAAAAADALVKINLLNDSQIWRANGSADTDANQLLERVRTNAAGLTIENNAGDVTGATGVFEILMNMGVAADRLLLGRFIGSKATVA